MIVSSSSSSSGSTSVEDVFRTDLTKKKIIQTIALQSLAELACTLSVGALVCAFTAAPVGISAILATVQLQTLLHLTIRCISGFAAYQERRTTGEAKAAYGLAAQGADFICPETFSWLTALNGQCVVHEGGHALAALTFYKGANPFIEIHPFRGGSTSYTANQLTSIGEKLGKRNAALITSAAGPALSILVSSVFLALSLQTKEKNPRISAYLESAALLDFSIHSFYALSALWTSPLKLSHDFVLLAKFGVHPVAAAVAIAAIPILITKFLSIPK